MSTSKKPLKPADFPVTTEGNKIKKQDGQPIAKTRMRISPPTSPSASTTTKPGAKRISGRPDRLSCRAGYLADKVQQRQVIRAACDCDPSRLST
ncbi:hypothetical protein [Bradyrhizobium japonicum]|uniref:hypothetical protein n=1 Tax=Bradyrhizobium japonicum TaxID=375 RepID=UPI003B67122F